MTNDDVKSIKDSLDKSIKLIRDKIALVNKNVKDQISMLHPRIDMLGARQELTNDKLDNHSAALINIESKLDAYGDMYKINDSNVRKVEKRLETLEENADITPPSEFVLANVS